MYSCTTQHDERLQAVRGKRVESHFGGHDVVLALLRRRVLLTALEEWPPRRWLIRHRLQEARVLLPAATLLEDQHARHDVLLWYSKSGWTKPSLCGRGQ